MIINYIKSALRSIVKNRVYSIINIAGLSISLAISLLMLLWVNDEYTTDKFHDKSEQLYRVKRVIPLENNVFDVYRGISYPLLKAAKEELPEVEDYITIGRTFEDNLRIGDKELRARGAFANAAFFSSFTYPLIIGDFNQLDTKLETIIISENLATIIFGDDWRNKALGSDILIHDNGNFVVEAVYENFPANSSIQNDFYYGFNKFLKDNPWMKEMGNNGMQGALLLSENANCKEVSMKLSSIFQANLSGENKESCFLQAYADDYLYGTFDDQAVVSGGRIEYVRIFSIAALLLLIISCINFVNLATVLASKRAKEVGIRKVIGAKKKALFSQFMVEAATITFISVSLAIFLAYLLIPEVNNLTDKVLSLNFADPFLGISIASIFILTTILAGAYPALILSSFKPINALKPKSNNLNSRFSLRKGLVVMQFGLALLLIISATIVQQQVHFFKNKNLGINKDNLLTIHQDKILTENYEVLSNELLNSEGIEHVTLAGPSPLNIQASTSGVVWPGKSQDQENIEFSMVWTASNFPIAFGIPMVKGKYYREEMSQDTNNIVFNEKAIEIMGLQEDPIGKTIQFWGKPRQIVGVIKDFHNRSLHEKIDPAAFILDADDAGSLFVKAEEGKMPLAIKSLEAAFKKVLPQVPLHYDFVDEQYAKLYKSEMLIGTLANYFAIISIFISCLGLFGLATFMAEQRRKEISIRKVLGANVKTIVAMLSKEFVQLIFVSILIAFPIGWYIMDRWLQNFEYKVALEWWVFAATGISAILIALFTISYQAIRAGIENPIKSLRSE